MTRARQERPGAPQTSTRYVALSGLAWGVIVTTFESLAQPPLEFSLWEFLDLYARIILHYGAGGLVMAWLAARGIGRAHWLPKWLAAVAIILAALAVALVIDRLSIWYVPFWSEQVAAMGAPPLFDVTVHLAWNFTIYGGLYILTFFFLENEVQTRERLRLSELARIKADDRMELALRGDRSAAIAPDLLLRALSELAQRYDQEHSRADRLLDKLVQLLRAVSGTSGNVDFARRLDQLRHELELPAQDVATGG